MKDLGPDLAGEGPREDPGHDGEIFLLAWEHIFVPTDELEEVSGREVLLSLLTILQAETGWTVGNISIRWMDG